MNSMRLLPLALLAAMLAAGCGGGSAVTSGSSANEVAAIVPADVPLLVAFETDPDSGQWQQADELLGKFPGRQRLLDSLQSELSDQGLDFEQDVVPALGDETYLAILDFEEDEASVVGLTQPRDKAKFAALLREADQPLQTREVDGWTLVAESEAVLDRFTAGGAKLDGAAWFADAQQRVEDEALVTLFANGRAINEAVADSLPAGCEVPASLANLEYATGLLRAEDEGMRFFLAAAGEGVQELVEGESMLANVPADVFAYLGAPGFDLALFNFGDQAGCDVDAQDVPDVGNLFGVDVDGLSDLFAGGFAFYAKRGVVIPEATLLLRPEDEAKAVATLDGLAESLADWGELEVQRRRIGDVEARALSLGPVTVLWGAGGGKVVVTTSPAGFDALTGEGDSLADDDDFRSAREAAGVGDDAEVYAYLDLRELIPIAEALAGLAGESVPREVRENLEPLESFLAWSDSSAANDVTVGAFLTIR